MPVPAEKIIFKCTVVRRSSLSGLGRVVEPPRDVVYGMEVDTAEDFNYVHTKLSSLCGIRKERLGCLFLANEERSISSNILMDVTGVKYRSRMRLRPDAEMSVQACKLPVEAGPIQIVAFESTLDESGPESGNSDWIDEGFP